MGLLALRSSPDLVHLQSQLFSLLPVTAYVEYPYNEVIVCTFAVCIALYGR